MPVMKLEDKLMCHSNIDFSFASHCPQFPSQPSLFFFFMLQDGLLGRQLKQSIVGWQASLYGCSWEVPHQITGDTMLLSSTVSADLKYLDQLSVQCSFNWMCLHPPVDIVILKHSLKLLQWDISRFFKRKSERNLFSLCDQQIVSNWIQFYHWCIEK